MKYCPFCGKKLQEDMVFCPSCGRRFLRAEKGIDDEDLNKLEETDSMIMDESFPEEETNVLVNETPSEVVPEIGDSPKIEELAKESVNNTVLVSAKSPLGKKKAPLWVIICVIAVIATIVVAVILSGGNGRNGGSNENGESDSRVQANAQSVLYLELYDANDEIIGSGSGFFINDGVTLVTNYHVIEDVSHVIAHTGDGKGQTSADMVLAYDELKDLAVLRCETDLGLPPITMGDSDAVKQGDKVYAIGYPLGLANTLSDGVVSSLYEDSYCRIIQTTAAISSGSSGGVLLNEDGAAIGVTAASYVDGQNMNIAIPINYVKEMLINTEPIKLSELFADSVSQDSSILPDKICMGTVVDNTYSSQFLGIRLTMNDDWMIADKTQLAELSGLVMDSFTDEDVKAQIEKGGSVMDLYALNQADGSSININLQKLSLISGTLVSEDDYAETNLKQLPEVLASSGITVDKLEKTKVTFVGQEHVALALEGTIQEIPLYETIVLVKTGPYIACVTAASYFEDTTGNLLAMFQPNK